MQYINTCSLYWDYILKLKIKKKNISNYVENVAPEDTYEQTTEQRHIHVK